MPSTNSTRRNWPRLLRTPVRALLIEALVAGAVLGGAATAHAQILGDAAPYFLWSDAWKGTISGTEEVEREATLHGVHVRLDNTTSASATVDFNQFNGAAVVRSWQGGEGAEAHITFHGLVTVQGGPGATMSSKSDGQGDVHLDPSYVRNGVMIDAAHWTYAVALQTCSPPKYCDTISVSQSAAVPGVGAAFGGASPDEEGVQDIATAHLPDPGEGLRGHDSTTTSVAGGRIATTLKYHLTPRFDIDTWAATYRADYIKARQSRLDAFKTVLDSKCHEHFYSRAFSTVCRAKDREQEALSEDADVATADFKRVVTALISEQCPGFTTELNKRLGRTKDVVIDGPIATYQAVRKVLNDAVVSDPHVSYQRLPTFMQGCLYDDYSYFKYVMTLRLPGTLDISF